MTPETFFFYDYETFGISPKEDRIAQFAGIRTDKDFNIIDEPINLYCKQYNDYLPNPESILITGITLEECEEKGIDEVEFSKKIHQEFSTPNTCILGYNNIRFDDEMTRYLFYRNFYDPYAYSWKNNNSRWDLLDLVRAAFALRPEGISWPTSEEGFPSFKLEELTKVNRLLHEKAHDALSDVYGTIAIAKLIKEKQPRLFQYYYDRRRAKDIKDEINLEDHRPFVHISGMFGNIRHNLSLVTPIDIHPYNKNALISVDLMGDIDQLIHLKSEDLKKHLYTKENELPNGIKRIPLKLIHLNKAPIIAPLSVLKEANLTEEHNISTHLKQHEKVIENLALIQKKVNNIYRDSFFNVAPHQDVEARLYDGFFNNNDRYKMDQLRSMSREDLAHHGFEFDDDRIETLLFRYRAKNYPLSLNATEQGDWIVFSNTKREQLRKHYLPIYQTLLEDHKDNDHYLSLLKRCEHYYIKK